MDLSMECITQYLKQYPDDGCGFLMSSGMVMIEGGRDCYIQPDEETEDTFLGRLAHSRECGHNLFYREWKRYEPTDDPDGFEEIDIVRWYKEDEKDKIWWLDNGSCVKGEHIFSFDRKTEFNLFRDYPWKLTREQKEIFDKENPFWADFFSERTKEDDHM